MTWRLARGQLPLEASERDAVASAIGFWHTQRCILSAWVVMDDRVHVLFALLWNVRLETLLHSWKSYSASQLGKLGHRHAPIWQDESFDRIVRSDLEMQRTILYICSNPLKRWPDVTEYRWVWPGLKNLA